MLLIGFLTVSGTAGYAGRNASTVHAMPLSRTVKLDSHTSGADPCGFRHAAWSLVQDAGDYLNKISSTQSVYEADKGSTYLNFKLSGIEVDYHYKSKPFDRLFGSILTALLAVDDSLNSADTGGFYGAMNNARRAQQKLWPVIKSICPNNGPARIWLGYLSQYGDGIQTLGVTVKSKHWELVGTFDCGLNTGNFIVNVSSPGRFLKGINQLGGGSYAVESYTGAGYYTIHVISECAWNVTVDPAIG